VIVKRFVSTSADGSRSASREIDKLASKKQSCDREIPSGVRTTSTARRSALSPKRKFAQEKIALELAARRALWVGAHLFARRELQ